MAKTTKNTKLSWQKKPYGGEYAHYKLGYISRVRINGKLKYNVSYGYRPTVENAKSLVAAKKRLDKITEEKISKS